MALYEFQHKHLIDKVKSQSAVLHYMKLALIYEKNTEYTSKKMCIMLIHLTQKYWNCIGIAYILFKLCETFIHILPFNDCVKHQL